MKFTTWIALFSQTGSEIAALSKAIKRSPDFVITNADIDNVNPEVDINFRINNDEAKTLDILEDLEFDIDSTLITLNGWLKIVPPDKCSKYNIYNGHPGLITKYPELKGKDPQQRAWDNIDNYDEIGSVVHRVVEEVDAGEIVREMAVQTKYIDRTGSRPGPSGLDATYDALRITSFTAWCSFLKEHLYNKV
jgi:folate-dependent phosphoribosylglycinamide formyltransferase PurN